MSSEIVNRPSLRQCPHPEARRSKVDKAWRVWFGKYVLGTVYQLHPKGWWYATGPTVTHTDDPLTFSSSAAAVQFLQGMFERDRPRRGIVEDEVKSPFLKYPRNDKGELELPPG